MRRYLKVELEGLSCKLTDILRNESDFVAEWREVAASHPWLTSFMETLDVDRRIFEVVRKDLSAAKVILDHGERTVALVLNIPSEFETILEKFPKIVFSETEPGAFKALQ